jgi:hypothetical protein
MAEDYSDRLQGYVEVHDRIAAFNGQDEAEGALKAKFPDGSLQGSYEIREDWPSIKDGEIVRGPLIIYTARAYRSQYDTRPGVGTASEPVPGHTPYTQNSELMNAETSAWGRALAAIGIKVREGIASANEVRARTGGSGGGERKGFASDKQRDYLRNLLDKADAPDAAGIEAYLEANFSGGRTGGISKAIDKLKENPATAVAELDSLAQEWHLQQESDVPKDEDDLPDPDQREAEDAKQETLT